MHKKISIAEGSKGFEINKKSSFHITAELVRRQPPKTRSEQQYHILLDG
jgi:hypothetical protein